MIETVAVGMVRDEGDVIAGTLRHLAGEVHRILVADNRSIDGTRETIVGLIDEGLPITLVDDLDPAYYQADKMTALAAAAAAWYPDDNPPWIVPFDADEVWTTTDDDPVHMALDGIWRAGYNIAVATLYDHYVTALDDDSPIGCPDPFRSMVWRAGAPAPLPKVAFRYTPGAKIHQGNHRVTLPGVMEPRGGLLRVDHFPYRSQEQMVHKARNGAEAYAATDLPDDMGAHWRQYGEILARLGDEGIHEVFREHFFYLSPGDRGMVREPARYLRSAPLKPCLPMPGVAR